jgi:hypothetical protein
VAKSTTPASTSTETGGGDTVIYRPGTTTTGTPPITNIKASTNLTITYQP